VPSQSRLLDRWSDGTARWLLIDFKTDDHQGPGTGYSLRVVPPAIEQPTPLETAPLERGGVRVTTGGAVFEFASGSRFPFSQVLVDGARPIDLDRSGLTIRAGGRALACRVDSVEVLVRGPLRCEIAVRGRVEGDDVLASALVVHARVELFVNSATARIHVTVRNRRRAQHPGGQWSLGDPGSVLLDSIDLALVLSEPVERIRCAAESGDALAEASLPFELHQESSGGEKWNGAVHCDRDGRTTLKFRGYRLTSGTAERAGQRATPVVVVNGATREVAVAMPKFWQNFPRAVSVSGTTIQMGLLAGRAGLQHELQGGEQKTHTLVVAFAADVVSDPPLAWCLEPSVFSPSAEWCCATGAIPFLAPASNAPESSYQRFVATALDPAVGFVAKRERIDEYGWRHFGDLFADHESAFRPPEDPFVSHYNNQYDAVACFATEFLRTTDARWWDLMIDLAGHVKDIDVYHTTEDKAAYNNGLFWHTAHYIDAGTSTHRTYPRGSGLGGGPSAEHNYATGLMLHYFLTGDPSSRETAIGLGRWVIDMDDGRLTVFRWLARGSTGLASASGSMSYHGPGRGPGNSIVACLAAYRLSGDGALADKVEQLIRRCIHPADDLEQRNLGDTERRWYYVVFLQALGAFLHEKQERGQLDDMFGYARASLLHYATWMAAHERPYLERPEVLEFPTETWAAQDMRKADVFRYAALHSEGAERARFVERAHFFATYSLAAVAALPGRVFTRPLVLIAANGVRGEWFAAHADSLPAPARVGSTTFGRVPPAFESQRARALRRAVWLAVAGAAALVALVTVFLVYR